MIVVSAQEKTLNLENRKGVGNKNHLDSSRPFDVLRRTEHVFHLNAESGQLLQQIVGNARFRRLVVVVSFYDEICNFCTRALTIKHISYFRTSKIPRTKRYRYRYRIRFLAGDRAE